MVPLDGNEVAVERIAIYPAFYPRKNVLRTCMYNLLTPLDEIYHLLFYYFFYFSFTF